MTTAYDRRAIGPLEFAHMGAEDTVYIRAFLDDYGCQQFGVHAVDGTQLAAHNTYEEALMTAHMNDLEAATLH